MKTKKTFLILSLFFISQTFGHEAPIRSNKNEIESYRKTGPRNLQEAVEKSIKKPKEKWERLIGPPEKLKAIYKWLKRRQELLEKDNPTENDNNEDTKKLPPGIIFTGVPGTGKTFAGKAVAGEFGFYLLYQSSADIGGKYVHEAVEHITLLLETARDIATPEKPVIIFFDEVHALAARQVSGESSGSNESYKALNHLLTEMTDKEANKNIIIIAATSKPEELEDAFTRPGRLSIRVDFTLPDKKSIKESIKQYSAEHRRCKNSKLSEKLINDMVAAKFTHASVDTMLMMAAVYADLDESWSEFSVADIHYQQAFNEEKELIQENSRRNSESKMKKREQADRMIDTHLSRYPSSNPKRALEQLQTIGYKNELHEKDIEIDEPRFKCDQMRKRFLEDLPGYSAVYHNPHTKIEGKSGGLSIIVANANKNKSTQTHHQFTKEGHEEILKKWNAMARCYKKAGINDVPGIQYEEASIKQEDNNNDKGAIIMGPALFTIGSIAIKLLIGI